MSIAMEPLRRSKRHQQWEQVDNEPFKEHPLLNNLILETIFGHLKGNRNALSLGSFRTVCKVWDREIVKLLRKETQTNLTNILADYPAGMGWTASRKNSKVPFYYAIPYPEVRPFENIWLKAYIFNSLKRHKAFKWFEFMGTHVKRLTFSSSFNILCQNKYLESILKEWCPNLEFLELCDVTSVESLLLKSYFLDNTTSLICKNLKDLKISVVGQKTISFDPNDLSTLPVWLDCTEIEAVKYRHSVTNFVSTIYNHSLSPSNTKPFAGLLNGPGNSAVLSEGLLENFRLTDGGIIGQIMKDTTVEKLFISGINDPNFQKDLVTLFHIRPNKWRSSLKHLELNASFSKSLAELHVIAQVKFLLTTLKLGGIHLAEENDQMTRFLSHFSETLEYLEIGEPIRCQIVQNDCQLILPSLPKLKKFVHEHIVACRLSAENMFSSAVNLETCYLKNKINQDIDINSFFHSTSPILSTSMKDFKLVGAISVQQAEMLLNWCPNLLKVELVLKSFETKARGFFEKLRSSKVIRLKVAFLHYLHQIEGTFIKSSMLAPWEPEDIKGLQHFELINLAGTAFHLIPNLFPKGKMTSLILVNFPILGSERDQILSGLSHIRTVELVNQKSKI